MKTSSVLLAQCLNSLAALVVKYIQNRKHRAVDDLAAKLGELGDSDVPCNSGLLWLQLLILCIQFRCRHTRTRCYSCGRPSWPTHYIAIDNVLCLLRYTVARRLGFLRRLDTRAMYTWLL